MPFIGGAIVPHSPLLLPTIGKEYYGQTKRTQRVLKALAHELYALRPDVIIVLHPHGPAVDGAFAASVSDSLTVSFAEFGDLVTTRTYRGAPLLSNRLRERAEDHGFPLILLHEPTLPYDVGVPLVILGEGIAAGLLPITTTTLDPGAHVNFGKLLAENLHDVSQRVFVLVSAELSHHTTVAAPGGARPEGATFDGTILRSLGKRRWAELLLKIDPAIHELAEACGYPPLLVLSGLLAHLNVHVKKLAYESPFGIGLLTASIHAA